MLTKAPSINMSLLCSTVKSCLVREMHELTGQYGTVIAASGDLNNLLVIKLAIIFVHRDRLILILTHIRQG
jgi:hypothetical protein